MRYPVVISTFLSTLIAAVPALAAGAEAGPHDLLYRVINFVHLIAVLTYFARKPLQSFFADRRNKIQDDLKNAAELRRRAEERHSKWQRRLVDLESELESIRAASRERAERERDEILEAAGAAAERIQAAAHIAIDQEVRRATEQLRDEASDLAVELAAEILREQVTAQDRNRLLDEFIERVEQPEADGR
jgi:F-type H+-transporting ATPase subunit b